MPLSWRLRDSDPHVSLAVGGVSIMEGQAPRYDEFVATFAERVQSNSALHADPADTPA